MPRVPRDITAACILGILLPALPGCGGGASGTFMGNPGDPDAAALIAPLRVAAASDLQNVLPALLDRFTGTARITTGATFDASGRLAEQIKAGAPFDLFLAANRQFVDDLAAAGLIVADSVRVYARGSLVLCVGEKARERVTRLEDLSQPEIRKIAIANPEYAPYGVAARQALERTGLWSALESRIVRADSVRQALFYVQNGDAEAALVSRALVDPQKIQTIVVDSSLYDPLDQSLGVVTDSRRREDATVLARFLLSPEGQSILERAGFVSPSSPESSAAAPGSWERFHAAGRH